MLDALHEFLYNARVFVCFITVPVGLYSAWRCYHALATPEVAPGARVTRRIPTRPPGAPPRPPSSDKPVQQRLITDKPAGPASVEAGKESRLNKALASTIRIDSGDLRHSTGNDAVVTVPDGNTGQTEIAEEVNQLFAGLDDQLQPSTDIKHKQTTEEREADALAKANRLEQLGFHRPTQHDTAGRPVNDPHKPTEAAKGPELDDILAKLDRVLANKPTEQIANSTAETAPTAPVANKAPLWARADATDEEVEAKPEAGKQLGLFEDHKDKPAT